MLVKALALLAALLAAGVVNGAEPLTPPAKRFTDEAIKSDYDRIAAVQKRIHALNDAGRPIADYSLSKAQCWLDTAFHEYSRNDRSGYPQAALSESRSLVAAMESGATPPRTTTLVAGAKRLREDLWARAELLKEHPGFRCVQQQVACLEVELVHAGHEYAQYGWRHARPYIQMAEDYAEQASAVAEACQPRPRPQPQPAAPPVAAAGPPERITLRADALFAFDRAGLEDITAVGRERLGEFAARLASAYERIDTVIIYGHADRLGHPDHNQKLSQLRSETVKSALESLGVKAPMTAVGRGSTQPVSSCGPIRERLRLIECLGPDRRVDIEVYGIRKP
jgi:OmpA-OmpF porin, OOP family